MNDSADDQRSAEVERPEESAIAGFGRVTTSYVLDDIPTPLLESLRYLIGRFQLGDSTPFPERLAVTSALHGEGVTTISRALAAVVAHDLDIRVCWVDLSWSGPWRTDRERSKGIAELLIGTCGPADALHATDDSRLTFLGSGTMSATQRDTFARSPVLGALLDSLAEEYDSVIFDVPPVLAGSAGVGQMRHANSYLLVVRHGVTSAQQVRSATEELAAISSLGVVLNHYQSSIPKRLTHFFVS